jgi:serine/threonine-protein kinase
MKTIKLAKGEWAYDPAKQLGNAGGFGAVYEGHSDEYGPLAVKRLHITAADAAHREMRIAADLSDRALKNVIPIFDAGEDAMTGEYYVVMPKADRSLQSDIGNPSTFTDIAAAGVLLDIVNGLLEVDDIVHRDLKPANILFHNGVWKVADFGIARFAEESTSLRTLKDCLSPPYAAPEQWQYIHVTAATDIYAMGCIGYALLTGSPPFKGPTNADFRTQHLNSDPQPLPAEYSPRLRTLIGMLLRKVPTSRPPLERVRTILSGIIQSASIVEAKGFEMLAKAGAEIEHQQARIEREQVETLSESESRNQLALTGRKILSGIIGELLDRIQSNAPNSNRNGLEISLGGGELEVSLSGTRGYTVKAAVPPNHFSQSKWDVVAVEEIVVRQNAPEYQWSASLWYCRLPNTSEFRWYEASYFAPFRSEANSPYSLARTLKDADLAAAPIMHSYQLAFGPIAIDDENVDEFIERWAAILALAAQGKLGHPRGLPLQKDFWRNPFVA